MRHQVESVGGSLAAIQAGERFNSRTQRSLDKLRGGATVEARLSASRASETIPRSWVVPSEPC